MKLPNLFRHYRRIFKLSLNKGAKLIPIGDEIARIQAYLKIQNYRFQDRYDLKIDIEDDLRKEYILTFILQPLVENSVLHGLEPKPGSGIIKISGKIVDGLIELYVCDDGVGIEDMDRIDRGYGLKNVRERIRLFYGEEYGIRFANKEDGGTIAKISIPQLSVEEVEATLKEEEERDNV
jgi:two-component system sensor histidine kinase YesM